MAHQNKTPTLYYVLLYHLAARLIPANADQREPNVGVKTNYGRATLFSNPQVSGKTNHEQEHRSTVLVSNILRSEGIIKLAQL